MVPPDDKQKFLDELENLPIVSVVCKRAGISKATIYRWIEDDADFKKKYDCSLKRGRETLVDHAESKLVKLVDKEVLGAIRMVLEANSKRYYKPRKPAPVAKGIAPIQTVRFEVIDANKTAEEFHRANEEREKRAQEMTRHRQGDMNDPWSDLPQ